MTKDLILADQAAFFSPISGKIDPDKFCLTQFTKKMTDPQIYSINYTQKVLKSFYLIALSRTQSYVDGGGGSVDLLGSRFRSLGRLARQLIRLPCQYNPSKRRRCTASVTPRATGAGCRMKSYSSRSFYSHRMSERIELEKMAFDSLAEYSWAMLETHDKERSTINQTSMIGIQFYVFLIKQYKTL